MTKAICWLGIIAAGLLAAPALSFAAVGETEAQLIKRFGQPVKTVADKKKVAPGDKELRFKTKECEVAVVLLKNRSEAEWYFFDTKIAGPEDKRIKSILKDHERTRGKCEWTFFDEEQAKMLRRQNFKWMWICIPETSDDGVNFAVRHDKPDAFEIKSNAFIKLLQ